MVKAVTQDGLVTDIITNVANCIHCQCTNFTSWSCSNLYNYIHVQTISFGHIWACLSYLDMYNG